MSTKTINDSNSNKGSKNSKYNRLTLIMAVATGAITVEAANLLLSSEKEDIQPISQEEVQEFSETHTSSTNSTDADSENIIEVGIIDVSPNEITLEESLMGEGVGEVVLDQPEEIEIPIEEIELQEEIELPIEDVEPYSPFTNNTAISEDIVADEVTLANNNQDMIAEDVVDLICGLPSVNLDDVNIEALLQVDDKFANNESSISTNAIQDDLMG